MNSKTLRIFSTIFSAFAKLTDDERKTALGLLQGEKTSVKTTTVPAFSESKPKLYDLHLLSYDRLKGENCYISAIKSLREGTNCSMNQAIEAIQCRNYSDFPSFVGASDPASLQALCDVMNREWQRLGKKNTLAWVQART